MTDTIFKEWVQVLKELELKVGRKTPESLLYWMKDAADREDIWRCDVVDRGDHDSALCDGISAKINHLKKELRWLRCADVRLLYQMVTVHEGIEAMRWVMEDSGALASQRSSLGSSLSSLVAVEELGPWMSPCRETPSPTCPQDLTEPTGEQSEQRPHTDDVDSVHKSDLKMQSPKAIGFPIPSSSKFRASWSIEEKSTNPSSGLVGASLKKSQSLDLDASPLKSLDLDASPLKPAKINANTIRKVLLRSRRVRAEVTVDTSSLVFTKPSDETLNQSQDSLGASQNNTEGDNNSTPNEEELLMGCDSQFCLVESQDDVTYL